jgi:hypothetical protein
VLFTFKQSSGIVRPKKIIKGVDSLFRKPIGFGEQTMIRLATNVYALTYLKETEQETDEIEAKGFQWIREGQYFFMFRKNKHFR